MPRGGPRPNSGRKPGSRNGFKLQRVKADSKVDATVLAPLILSVWEKALKSEDQRTAIQASMAAAQYAIRKQPQATEISGPNGGALMIKLDLECPKSEK